MHPNSYERASHWLKSKSVALLLVLSDFLTNFFQYFNAGGNLIKAILSLRVGFMGLLHFGGLVVVYWAAVVECSFR